MAITSASGIITPEVPNNKEQLMYHIIKDNGDRIYVSNGKVSKISNGNGISKINNGNGISKTKLAIVIVIAIIAIISLI